MKYQQENIDCNQVGVECQDESVDLAGVNTLESKWLEQGPLQL
jgi:hypothetical protein